MPYYSWIGIDLQGNDYTGRQFAGSVDELEQFLARRSIGLVKAKSARWSNFFYHRRLSTESQILLLEHLSFLLNSQIRLYDALVLVSQSISYGSYVSSAFFALAEHIKQGESVKIAFEQYPKIFDSVSCVLLEIGEKSGALPQILHYIVSYKRNLQEIRIQLKKYLLQPGLTLIFFCIIVLFIFTLIIPRFEHIFITLDKPIPAVTQVLFTMSHWFTMRCFKWTGVLLMSIAIGIHLVLKCKMIKQLYSKILVYMPGISSFVLSYWRLHILKTLSMLLAQKIPLDTCLDTVTQIITNSVIKDDIEHIIQKIRSGLALSTISTQSLVLADRELSFFILIGESSGRLAENIQYAACLYEKKLYNMLAKCIAILQPMLLLVLGVLIGLLLGALYAALLSISFSF